MAASRPRRCSRGSRRCRFSSSPIAASSCRSSISTRRWLRRPSLLLVDELAHTNAEGLRHAKRWQDVFELLDAGIDVWTTLNVQHIESLNDVISEITGVVVRETLPDAVLEQADEIELIDLTPAELVERLHEGKIYLPTQAERALKSFFQKGNLTALRELSLRQAAQRLAPRRRSGADRAIGRGAVADDRAATGVRRAESHESPAFCGPPNGSRRRLAPSGSPSRSTQGRGTGAVEEATGRNLRLAEKLGAETHTLIGRNVAETLIDVCPRTKCLQDRRREDGAGRGGSAASLGRSSTNC